MFSDLNPYLSYRDSTVLWLGKIPLRSSVRLNDGPLAQWNESQFPKLDVGEPRRGRRKSQQNQTV